MIARGMVRELEQFHEVGKKNPRQKVRTNAQVNSENNNDWDSSLQRRETLIL